MAKYTRFDPRNKNRGRNKQRSMERDLRIRETEKKGRQYVLQEVRYDNIYNEDVEYEDTYLTEGGA